LSAGAAADLVVTDPAKCLPAIVLRDDYAAWSARRDLLESGPYSRDFVVETGISGKPLLRFGDGVNGTAAPLGELLKPSGRFGMGRAGNLGAGALGHVVVADGIAGADISVTNPLPASGGVDPEPIASIRINAPQAYRVQERAVTAGDYAAAALRHPEVANAMAFARWTGAWQTMTVCIDRLGGTAVDAAFRAALLTHMEYYRLMGFDVKIEGARPAPLDLRLSVCVAPGELRSKVAADLRNELRPRSLATGAPGFFHPDNFTFGSPLYLSQLIERAMRVRGVTSVEPLVFKRLGRIAHSELADGVIAPQGTEILELDDDPNFPERGRLELVMGGGR
jgi:predicted phage baseplate assembly protein